MRSLEDIFVTFSAPHVRTVLFEEGLWCIYCRENDKCYIIHRCEQADRAQDLHIPACKCGKIMPDKLLGLLKLLGVGEIMLIDLPGNWQLSTPSSSHAGLHYVWHHHAKGSGHDIWTCHTYKQGSACNSCGEPMPDEIGGFIQLLEWER